MPLFNRRNKAGSGAGEQIHIGHQDPFSVAHSKASRDDEYNRMALDLKAQNPDKVNLPDPFAPPKKTGGVSLSRMADMKAVGDAQARKAKNYGTDPFA